MGQGGKRPGAGRKKGSVIKRTKERAEKIAASGLTPLDYLIEVMRNEDAPPCDRIDAAKAAAPYVHSKMPTALIAEVRQDESVGEDDESILATYEAGLRAADETADR